MGLAEQIAFDVFNVPMIPCPPLSMFKFKKAIRDSLALNHVSKGWDGPEE